MVEQLRLDFDGTHYAAEDEGHYYDRKSARINPEATIRHVIAFANAGGGELAIGIENDGEITGFAVEGAHRPEEYEQVPIKYCEPTPMFTTRRIPVVNSDNSDDEILVIEIQPSENRVVRHREKRTVYLREGDNSIQLTPDQIRALEYDKGQIYFENELELSSSIDDIDHEVLDRFKESLGTTAPDDKVLRARGFYKDGHLTRAGVLLFAENPSMFYPCARVRVLKINGSELQTGPRMNIVKDVTFEGPLPKTIEDAKNLISTLLREFQFLGRDGKFETIPEYPEFAWFEGLVNAITHRDYSFAGDYIRVYMYDDRLEIFSPGKLPNIVTLDNMKNTRFARNPNIARTLNQFGWVRELNEGVQRIYDEMQSYFLNEPVFSEPNNSAVLLTLENSATSRMLRTQDSLEKILSPEVLAGLNENEYAAVQYVYSRHRITPKELSSITGRKSRTVTSTLKELEKKGILTWHGTSQNDPTQYYTLATAE